MAWIGQLIASLRDDAGATLRPWLFSIPNDSLEMNRNLLRLLKRQLRPLLAKFAELGMLRGPG